MLEVSSRKQGLRAGSLGTEVHGPESGAGGALARQHAGQLAAVPVAASWGWIPELAVVCASAVFVVALATPGAYAGAGWAEPLFWAGLLLIYVPAALRLGSAAPSRFERIGILVLMVAALYLIKLVHSPTSFTFADELVHSYNANAILHSGRLFTENSVLRVSALYPGLEIVTAWLMGATGVPLYVAGAMVVGTARLILVLALFLLFEEVSGSPRPAGLAAAVYMAQPNFLFWSSQYSYESLSLPVALALLVLAARFTRRPVQRGGCGVLFVLGALALVMTHHLTVFALFVMLAAWAAVEALVGSRRRALELASFALFTLAAGLLWLFWIASPTIAYLSPVLARAVASIVNMIAGEQSGRQLFVSSSGHVAPLWERAAGIGSVLLSFAVLPFGLREVWRRHWRSSLAWVLAAAAVLYFGVLPLRLTGAGWETGNRAAAYLFLGLAFVLGLAADNWLSAGGRRSFLTRLAPALIGAGMTVIFLGGIISGWAPQLRLARPLMVAANGSTFWPQGWAAADWARRELGPGQVFAADEANGRLLLAEGDQFVLAGRHPGITELLRDPKLAPWQVAAMNEKGIRYVLVDKRKASWDNMAGYFYDRLADEEFFDSEQTGKFDGLPVDRILDTGNIVVYDAKGLSNGTSGR